MKPPKIITFPSLLLVSTALILLQLKPVEAFEIPAGLEREYQQILSVHNNALLPSSIPVEFTSVEVNTLNSFYAITFHVNQFQNVLIAVTYDIEPYIPKHSRGLEQISLSNQITGYLLPAGETDEASPQLTFIIGTTKFFLGGWVDPNDLVSIANSMIENQ